VVLTGLRTVFHWHDNWTRFMIAGATLKSELRLYGRGVAPYDHPSTKDGRLIQKVNDTELSETTTWASLSAPDSPGPNN
jgi:hypothetical protein